MDKNHTWTNLETIALIEAKSEFESRFEAKGGDFTETWRLVQVKSNLTHIPLHKIKYKWKNLVKKYRTLCEADKNLDDSTWKDAYDWLHFDAMHKLMGHKKYLQPWSLTIQGLPRTPDSTSPNIDPLVEIEEEDSEVENKIWNMEDEPCSKVSEPKSLERINLSANQTIIDAPKSCHRDTGPEINGNLNDVQEARINPRKRSYNCIAENKLPKTQPLLNNNENREEFQIFGDSVAIQLTKLPLRIAIQLQADFQNQLTRARLQTMEIVPSSASTCCSLVIVKGEPVE